MIKDQQFTHVDARGTATPYGVLHVFGEDQFAVIAIDNGIEPTPGTMRVIERSSKNTWYLDGVEHEFKDGWLTPVPVEGIASTVGRTLRENHETVAYANNRGLIITGKGDDTWADGIAWSLVDANSGMILASNYRFFTAHEIDIALAG